MTILNKDKILETAKEFVTQGKFDKAIREYEKLLEADPKDMRVKLRVAELYAKRRQIPEAIRAYRDVAEVYAAEGFYLKAVTVYKSILRLNPSLLDVNQALADLYEKMGLNLDAVHQYEILASALEQKGQFLDALKIRQKLVELAPMDAGHRVRLAEGYQREEKKEEAIEQYEILAKQFQEQKKEPQKLIELYERILPYRPQNKEMLAHLVHLYHGRKDYKSALKWMEQNKQGVQGDVELISLQAEMYAALNQLETARGKYQELAEVYLEKGEKEKALSAYQEILVLLPEEAETIRPMVEAIQQGATESLIRVANQRRQKKTEESQAEETLREKEKEAKEKARNAQKVITKPTPPLKVTLSPPSTKPTPLPPTPSKQAKHIITQPVATGAKEIADWLKRARSSLSLAKAYQSTGLSEEAKQEFIQAREVLKKILAVDSSHEEAKQMMEELNRALPIPKGSKLEEASPKPSPDPLKIKKKISFV